MVKKVFKEYRFEFLLSFLVVISRIPFVSKILYSWDAVQLSLAIKDFNLEQHQPHPQDIFFMLRVENWLICFLIILMLRMFF